MINQHCASTCHCWTIIHTYTHTHTHTHTCARCCCNFLFAYVRETSAVVSDTFTSVWHTHSLTPIRMHMHTGMHEHHSRLACYQVEVHQILLACEVSWELLLYGESNWSMQCVLQLGFFFNYILVSTSLSMAEIASSCFFLVYFLFLVRMVRTYTFQQYSNHEASF